MITKKTILIASALLFFGFAPHVLADGFVALAPIPGLTQGITANTAGLAQFFNNLYRFAIGMAAVLAIIQIIWGGIEIAVNKDNVSKIIDSKGRILQAILGLVLVLSPVLVFSIINPSILNLSINLRELDTRTAFQAGTNGTGTGGVGTSVATDPSSLCNVNGISGILQIAVCPSSEAARTWGQSCTSDNLSRITELTTTNSANGIATNRSVITCTGRQNYRFIDPGGTYTSWSTAVNRLRPLSSTTNRPNNGSDAINFANICSSAGIGWQTCISNSPAATFAVPCQLTGVAAQTTWRCYDEVVSCINQTNLTSRGLCSDNPGWTAFQ